MMERAALSEILKKYEEFRHFDTSDWAQGEKNCAVPSEKLQVLATHESPAVPLWLDKTAILLKTRLLALKPGISRLGKHADLVLKNREALEDLSESDFASKMYDWQHSSKFERSDQIINIRSVDIVAMAGVCEAVRRVLGFCPHREQVIGAFAILEGSIAEMATGEGKTLTANLSAIVAAWRGMPVHVITANDYLAARDCELGQDLFARCGVTAASITGDTPPDARSAGYAHEIVYTTARDMLADHLRDDLALSGKIGRVKHALAPARNSGKVDSAGIVMRGVYQVIVDEADSVLIDEAVTPLIISSPKPDDLLSAAAIQAVTLARELEDSTHYSVDHEMRNVELTKTGREKVADMVLDAGAFWQRRDRAEELVNIALYAMHMMVIDKHYILEEGKVVLVDELTGRLARERTLSLGVQQVLEASLDVEISDPSEVRARLSFQSYFQRLPRIGGMTGTAHEARLELGKVYGLGITRVPTHQITRRKNLGCRVFENKDEKLRVIVEDVKKLALILKTILVGLKSVLTSQEVARAFDKYAADLPIEILNAVNNAEENSIVARAGQCGAVTVATNMAGRGTDIKISQSVRNTGGLHVIIAETNDFSRIDRQLIGRCARQGDPGTCIRYVALNEDVVVRFLPKFLQKLWMISYRLGLFRQHIARLMLYLSQKRAEILAYKQRKVAFESEIETEKDMI